MAKESELEGENFYSSKKRGSFFRAAPLALAMSAYALISCSPVIQFLSPALDWVVAGRLYKDQIETTYLGSLKYGVSTTPEDPSYPEFDLKVTREGVVYGNAPNTPGKYHVTETASSLFHKAERDFTLNVLPN